MVAKALIGRFGGIEERGHIHNLVEHTGNHIVKVVRIITGLDGHIDMEAIAGFVFKRLRAEIHMYAIAARNRFDDGLEGHRIVSRSQRIRITEVNFVLAGTFFVVRAFRTDAHLLQCQTDLPADILPLSSGAISIYPASS